MKNSMKVQKSIAVWLLILSMLLGFVPATPAAQAAAPSAGQVTIRQSASWDGNVPGNTLAKVDLEISSAMDLQTPKDVVFVIDRAASQSLDSWKNQAKALAGMLSSVPGMRFALVSYTSAAEKILDFTGNVSALNSAVDSITLGTNCNAYDGLQQARRLIESRTNRSNRACIVLLSNGRFNLNLARTEELGRQLRAAGIPVYGLRFGDTAKLKWVCSELLYNIGEIAMEIGESRRVSLTVTGRLDTAHFTPVGSSCAADGTFTRTISSYRLGSSLRLSFSGKLTNRQEIGTIPVAGEASAAVNGTVAATAGAVSLSRSGLTVTYDANGGTGDVPWDSNVYMAGDMVSVKPASPTKPGWHFSGWTHPNLNLTKGSFEIGNNTTLHASWGRAFVKLSSSTVNANLKGTQMLSQKAISEKYKNTSFYDRPYWNNLSTVTLHNSVDIPVNCAAYWDITDTSVAGNEAGAVMAWAVPCADDNTKYDLHIGGRGGLTAPASCASLFINCPASKINGLDILDTSKVKSMATMFSGAQFTELNLSSFDTSQVTNMSYMFDSSEAAELDLSSFDTSSVTTMSNMFCNSKAKTLRFGEKWSTAKVTQMGFMFNTCSNLTELALPDWDVSLSEGFWNMFAGCSSLKKLDLSGWKTSSIVDLHDMFASCTALTDLNLSGWDTSKVRQMSSLFSHCESLSSLDLTGWSTGAVTTMYGMFSNCKALPSDSLTSIADWDVSKVGTMEDMFMGCSSLTTLNLKSWNMRQVYNIKYMFYGCTNLESIGLGSASDAERLEVKVGCTADYLQTGADKLPEIWVWAGGDYIDTKYPNSTRPGAPSMSSMDTAAAGAGLFLDTAVPTVDSPELPAESTEPPAESTEPPAESTEPPAESTEPPAESTEPPANSTEPSADNTNPVTASALLENQNSAVIVQYAPRSSDHSELGAYNRPIYADNKVGTWDCGEVPGGQVIQYALELQYLNPAGDPYEGGTSGLLTVTNPLPEGLTYNNDAVINPAVQWVVGGSGYTPTGTIVSGPSVSNNVLTFSVTGLTAGAKYVVTYSCTAPAATDTYLEFWNNASVEDNGLTDYADPVLHYMNGLTTPTKYDVSYEYSDGNPGGAAVPPAQTYAAGTTITLPQPSVPGYTFNGWTLGGAYVSGSHEVTGDATFIGSWTADPQPETVDVHYTFASVDPEIEEIAGIILESLLEGVPTTFPANAVTSAPVVASVPEGWTFRWRYPGGLTVDENGAFSVGTASKWPTGISIVGEWSRKAYRLTYTYADAPADAPALPSAQMRLWGEKVSLAPDPKPASTESHIFLGWSGVETDENGDFEMPMEDVTIVGTWMARPPQAEKEVLISPNGGTWNGQETDSVLTLSEYNAQKNAGSFPNPEKPGQVFQGWEESADPEGNFALILTADWQAAVPEPERYTVTFDSQGGSAVAAQTATAGDRVSRPVDPIRDGFLFQGWYRDREGQNAWNFETDTVTGDLTLYAWWKELPKRYTITFDSQGGSAVAAQAATAGDRVSRPVDPKRDGFLFQGWYRDREGQNAWNFETDTVTGNLTLYAWWKEQGYNITGTVTGPDKAPISGALVRVVQGNDEFMRTTTGADGQYSFADVVPGIYNVVAIYKEVTTTILCVVKDQDLTNQNIVMPDDKTNSVLDVDLGAPNVVVGGLAYEAGEVRKGVGGADIVIKVQMDIKDITPAGETEGPAEAVEEIRAIEEEARRNFPLAKLDLVLEITVDKTIDSTTEPIHSTIGIMEMVIPYEMEGKREIRVHRYHDAAGDSEGATTFTELTTRPNPDKRNEVPDRTFYLDREYGLIHIYARKFSTYAVSYVPEGAQTPEEPALPEMPVWPSAPSNCIITASAEPGGSIQPVGKVAVPRGGSRTFSVQPEDGYVIGDILVDGKSVGARDSYTFRDVQRDHTIKAVFVDTRAGETSPEHHKVYLKGFDDGSFRPDAGMTRGQAAQMFYNLLEDQTGSGESAFTDVSASAWYAPAVTRLSALGVVQGVGGGRFEPDRPITRAEFVSAVLRFTQSGEEAYAGTFTDVASEDWFALQVEAAAGQGWITGYDDGTFRPGHPISRSEVTAIMNRVLKRSADRDYVDLHNGALRGFPDVRADHWAYYDIMEAVNAHNTQRTGEAEIWERADSVQ